MGVGSYLRLKGRASVFRRKVPEALRARLARTEICATLGIVSRDSAERGARQVAVAVDAFFASALRDMTLNSADLSRVVAATIQAWREDDERHNARFVLAHGRALGNPREMRFSSRKWPRRCWRRTVLAPACTMSPISSAGSLKRRSSRPGTQRTRIAPDMRSHWGCPATISAPR